MEKNIQTICSNPTVQNLARGSFLRVFSDLTGATVLENVKCRVTVTKDGPIEATRALIAGGNGDSSNSSRSSSSSGNSSSNGCILNLWSGTSSRTVEGSLSGALFLVGSTAAKKQVLALGGGAGLAALAGGLAGGFAQAIILTPSCMVFTSLNVNKGKPGYEDDTTLSVTRRIVKEKGIQGMYIGMGPMSVRQASNWASRGLFTEICRTNLNLARFGLIGEIGSGVIGGIGSCWNTPIETVRVLMQKDVSEGRPPKTFRGYVLTLMNEGGAPALFRGVTPRAAQAMWQTVFMVVVPNLLGL